MSLFVCVEKKKKKSFVFTFISCFQFSSWQLCIHLCQTTSACIPTSRCLAPTLNLWLSVSWQPSNCISLPSIFPQFKLISRCALLYKTHFLFFCHVLYLPVSDAFIPLSLSLTISLFMSVSLLLFLSVSFPLSVCLPKKHLMPCTEVLSWFLSCSCYLRFLFNCFCSSSDFPTIFFLGSDAAAHCFCL